MPTGMTATRPLRTRVWWRAHGCLRKRANVRFLRRSDGTGVTCDRTRRANQLDVSAMMIVRIVDGMLVEHWDVIEDEASRTESKSGRPMFGADFSE
jgi:predicted SnoaL-like aldol condensation-catalyzing enzyme